MPAQPPKPILLLAAGEPPSEDLAIGMAKKASGILCTDGSYATAVSLGLKPRWVIGDMDSLPPDQTLLRGTLVLYDGDQDCSDFEKAVKFILKLGGDRAWVLGAFGKRVDHFLSALSVAAKYAAKVRLTFLGEDVTMELVDKKTDFRAPKGEIITLLPVDNPSWLSLSGVRYPVTREPLFAGSRGLSNEAKGGKVSVEVHSGKVWLIRTTCLRPERPKRSTSALGG